MVGLKFDEIICPMVLTQKLIGGKWKLIILWELRSGVKRFGELRRILHGITQKMLTGQLRELENDRLINRKVYAIVPPKVEYSLTEYGKELLPIFELMYKWGEKYMKKEKNNDR